MIESQETEHIAPRWMVRLGQKLWRKLRALLGAVKSGSGSVSGLPGGAARSAMEVLTGDSDVRESIAGVLFRQKDNGKRELSKLATATAAATAVTAAAAAAGSPAKDGDPLHSTELLVGTAAELANGRSLPSSWPRLLGGTSPERMRPPASLPEASRTGGIPAVAGWAAEDSREVAEAEAEGLAKRLIYFEKLFFLLDEDNSLYVEESECSLLFSFAMLNYNAQVFDERPAPNAHPYMRTPQR